MEAFNNLTAPGEDPTKSNCFQLLSLHLDNPSAPLNLLNSLFSLHPQLDYMITLLPRYNCLNAGEVAKNYSPDLLHVPALCLRLFSPASVQGRARNQKRSCIWFTRLPFARVFWWSLPPIPICLEFGHLRHRSIAIVKHIQDLSSLRQKHQVYSKTCVTPSTQMALMQQPLSSCSMAKWSGLPL